MPEPGAGEVGGSAARPVTVLCCAGCGALDAGPRTICPKCAAAKLERREVPGAGRLMTWTVIRRPPLAFKEEGAYAIALVRLDAGVEVTGRLASVAAAESGLTLGARMRCTGFHREVPVFEAE